MTVVFVEELKHCPECGTTVTNSSPGEVCVQLLLWEGQQQLGHCHGYRDTQHLRVHVWIRLLTQLVTSHLHLQHVRGRREGEREGKRGRGREGKRGRGREGGEERGRGGIQREREGEREGGE